MIMRRYKIFARLGREAIETISVLILLTKFEEGSQWHRTQVHLDSSVRLLKIP